MKKFMDEDFLLDSETARRLYHDHAKHMPIIDFHNHLNTKEIWEDVCFPNLAEVWLSVDHYKWRIMRAAGVPEGLITGEGKPFEKFKAWAAAIQGAVGNPLYHWTHLELKRYFGIDRVLSPETAEEIWHSCNKKLQGPEFSVRKLLKMQNVRVLCTTDDPADDLMYHKKLKESGFEIQVRPTFRPEKAIGIEKDGFQAYIEKLEEACSEKLGSVSGLLKGLEKRLDYFVNAGCRVTDHSLEAAFWTPALADLASAGAEAARIYQKRLAGGAVTEDEAALYRGYMLTELGKAYARRGLVMQLHIGALRNNSGRMFDRLGVDAGFDSLNDFNYAPQLSALLNACDRTGELPKTVLYSLNGKDTDMLAAMAGNFQSNEEGIKGKVQLGTAWWFGDNKSGMEKQMQSFANAGLLSTFIGMLTDSRSFLSFPRHEYFRRILCNQVGALVENGEYPADMEYLGGMIENICCGNAMQYFGFNE